MQDNPEKEVANYNEVRGADISRIPIPSDILKIETLEEFDRQFIVETGLDLVHRKVDEILGVGNRLTGSSLVLPQIVFTESISEHPTWAGYFSSYRNEIGIITGKVKDRLSQTKVFIHEYIHFLSHNGRDDSERVSYGSPLSKNNNVGFRRYFGFDVRAGSFGQHTGNYFLAFNEAVTEQLAIDILPGVHETYSEYRGLLSQVIDDAVAKSMGSTNTYGEFQPWSKQELKDYIYRCFFKGNLAGFSSLLQKVYSEYNLTESQFGLMTHQDDLPTGIESTWRKNDPDGSPPSPSQVAAVVQLRLDNKTPDDYITDTIIPDPDNSGPEGSVKHGLEYDVYVQSHNIVNDHSEVVADRTIEIDSLGYLIYRGEEASSLLENIRVELDAMLDQVVRGKATVDEIIERIDYLLFQKHYISMLSDGFREFYIYKHTRFDNL